MGDRNFLLRQRKQANVLPLHSLDDVLVPAVLKTTTTTTTTTTTSTTANMRTLRRRNSKSLPGTEGQRSSFRLLVVCVSITVLLLFGLWRMVAMAFFPSTWHTKKTNLTFVQDIRQQFFASSFWHQHRQPQQVGSSDNGEGVGGYKTISCYGLFTPHLYIRATVNNNVCECLDGHDELETAACAHVLVGQAVFDCGDGNDGNNNNNNKGTKIMASRIHDGIRDCPNGRDEI